MSGAANSRSLDSSRAVAARSPDPIDGRSFDTVAPDQPLSGALTDVVPAAPCSIGTSAFAAGLATSQHPGQSKADGSDRQQGNEWGLTDRLRAAFEIVPGLGVTLTRSLRDPAALLIGALRHLGGSPSDVARAASRAVGGARRFAVLGRAL